MRPGLDRCNTSMHLYCEVVSAHYCLFHGRKSETTNAARFCSKLSPPNPHWPCAVMERSGHLLCGLLHIQVGMLLTASDKG